MKNKSPDLSVVDIEQFVLSVGSKNANRVFRYLYKTKSFIDAMETDLGKELLSDLVKIMDKNLNNIIIRGDKESRIGFKIAEELLIAWCDKINSYNQTLIKVKQGGK